MIRLLFFGFFLLTALRAEDFNNPDTYEVNVSSTMPKVLYLNYTEVPKRIVKGEIFSVTIKTLATVKDFIDITYLFSNYQGLESFNEIPSREKTDKYYYDTFYFLVTKNQAKLPDITASLVTNSQVNYKKTTLLGENLNIITLNPKKDFSNIIANSFELIDYKTTSYDNKHNIIVFVATAQNCNIKALKLNNVLKQGIESITESYIDSKITYYAVIDKNIQNFSFSYFNLTKNKFMTINIPIVVDDDSVTTQSDLKPTNQSHEMIKISIAASAALIGIIFIFWRKKYIYLVFILIPLFYIAYISAPSKEVCINKDSNIYLLPVYNGTIFETTQTQTQLQKEGSIKEFTKVKLKNDKIGWVRNEDICSN